MEETEELSRIEKQAKFLEEYVKKNFQGIVESEHVAELYEGMVDGDVGIENENIQISENPLLKKEGNHLYTQRNVKIRKEIKEKIEELRKVNTQYSPPSNMILPADSGLNFDLNKEQKLAIEKAFEHNFLVVTGGPGTGKTTTVKYIIKNLIAEKVISANEVVMCAPTGKAQARMKESVLEGDENDADFKVIGQNATTVHRLLGKYNMHLKYNEDKPIPYKMIIVDECSMIDISLFHDLLMAINTENTRLILLGDQYQLPPIGLGAVFTELCNSSAYSDNVVTLIESNRFEDTFLIKKLANAINDGKVDNILHSDFNIQNQPSEDEVIHIVAQNNEMLDTSLLQEDWRKYFENQIVENVARFSPENEDFKSLTAFTILSATNKGRNGVSKICEEIHTKLKPKSKKKDKSQDKDKDKDKDSPFLNGQLVLVTKNQPDLKIFNGDIGIIAEKKGVQWVLFPNGLEIKPQTIIEHKMGYALSIHKSQGSEYNNVMIILADATDKIQEMLNRQLLYTAVTRARDLVVIQTTKKILEATIEKVDERITNIFK